MKYLNVFDDKSALDSSVASINHGDGAYVFGVTTRRGIQDVTIYDQRHIGANCQLLSSVNMEPVKLDESSTKENPNVADVLYSTADGKLTLDSQTDGANNTPIAICVIPEVMENFSEGDNSEDSIKTARFVSLNYMNYKTPTTGSTDFEYMYFGNYGITIGNIKGYDHENGVFGGKWNTQQCLSKATKQDPYICNGITNDSGEGYCAPACCCVSYSTQGTKLGDWYLPMPGELYQIYANKTAINGKRTTLVGNGFNFETVSYWNSRECSDLTEGITGNNYVSNIDKAEKCHATLAFLSVKVPNNSLS